jgi:molybdate/tungstate transport system substrate-binding protein
MMCLVLVLTAACGTSGPSSSQASGRKASSPGAVANVAFAGSLLYVDNEVVGPAFERSSGYLYRGRGGGSFGLAREIQAGEIFPNVFESVGGAPVRLLEPRFTTWYLRFAASPLVIAYNPRSPYAKVFEAVAQGKAPLADAFLAMAKPGFLLGRTNPGTDPQGRAFVMMVELAQRDLGLPPGTVEKILGKGVLHGTGGRRSQIFAETALESELQAGVLDAASAFLSEAIQLHLHYVALPPELDFGSPAFQSSYASATMEVPGNQPGRLQTVHGSLLSIDVTVIAPRDGKQGSSESRQSAKAARAFVAYLISPAGRREYAKEGFLQLPPELFGKPTAFARSLTSRTPSISTGG